MVLVDTSVWIDYFNGIASRQTDRLDALLATGVILTGDLILAELLQGFTRESDYRRARTLMDELPYADLVGRAVALQAAQNYRVLRARGVTTIFSQSRLGPAPGTLAVTTSTESPETSCDSSGASRPLTRAPTQR